MPSSVATQKSRPLPPCTMSDPESPRISSRLGPPSTWSSEPPPVTRSAPRPPPRSSVPRPPTIRSSPPSPTSASSPLRPQITSRLAVPRRTSFPFVPEIVHPDGPAASRARATGGISDATMPTTAAARRHRSLVGAAGLHHLVDLLHDLGVGERGDVAERATAGDIADEPAHDLARTRLREIGREDDPVGPRDLADLVRDVLSELAGDRIVPLEPALQRDERDDRLAHHVVGS